MQLLEYKYLTTDLLHQLLQQPSTSVLPTKNDSSTTELKNVRGFGRQALYKRLNRLLQHGFIGRRFVHPIPNASRGGGPQAVYQLTLKSTTILHALLKITKSDISSRLPKTAITDPNLKHTLGVNQVHASLIAACNVSRGRVRLIYWETEPSFVDAIKPDAVFSLQIGSNFPRLYFLEFDRGTVPLQSRTRRTDIKSRLINYYAYRKRQGYRTHFRFVKCPTGSFELVTNPEGTLRNHSSTIRALESSRGFTTLFVIEANNLKRIENIQSLLGDLGKGFSGSAMFRFTLVQHIRNPDGAILFSPIWYESNSLSERSPLLVP